MAKASARNHADTANLSVAHSLEDLLQSAVDAGSRPRKRSRRRFHSRSLAGDLLAALDGAPIGIHFVNVDGIIVWANSTELQMLGYTRDEFVGRHIAEFHVDAATILDILRRLEDGETLKDYEARLRHKDGSTRLVSITSNVASVNGRFVHTRCFTRDLTATELSTEPTRTPFGELEEVRRRNERGFREVIDALPIAAYMTDASGHLTHFNAAAVEFSGRVPELGTDRWCVSWKLYRADGSPLPHDECPMAIALKEARCIRNVEAIAERPDGTRRWFVPYPTPLLDDNGRVVGGINTLVDITERRQPERARQIATG